MKKEDAKYILEAIEWITENSLIEKTDMEIYGNLVMSSQNLLIDEINKGGSTNEIEWVDTSERLPLNKHNNFSEWVLCVDSNGNVFKTKYDYKYNQWMDLANVPKNNQVTHWTKIPTPPSCL